MKAILISVAILIFGNHNLFATAQYPDNIIFEGKEYMLHSNPMETYFEKYPDKRPKGGIMSTALWRGYVATFIVKENELYLENIEIEVREKKSKKSYKYKWKSVIKDLIKEGEELKIDWITGILVIPHGKIKNYVHMGYASTYSNYILLEVEKGKVNKTKKMKYRKYVSFKKKQFEAFRKTEKYSEMVEDLKKEDGYNEKYIESFLRDFVIEYTSKFVE